MNDKIVLQLLYNSNIYLKEEDMSAKTASVIARTEPETKKAADKLFAKLGLTTSAAINIFLHKAVEEKGFPFKVTRKMPNIPNLDVMTKEEIKKMLDESMADYEKNGGYPAEEVFEELDKKYGIKV